MRGDETFDLREVQKLAASVRIDVNLDARSAPDMEALFISALAAALGIRREDVSAVQVEHSRETGGGHLRKKEYKLTYEVAVPDGMMSIVLQKAGSLSISGSLSANRFMSALESGKVTIYDVTAPVTFQGLAGRRNPTSLHEGFQIVRKEEKEENESLPFSLGTWLFSIGASLLCFVLGCAGAQLWRRISKDVARDLAAQPQKPSVAAIADDFSLEFNEFAACAEVPSVPCLKPHTPGRELLRDLKFQRPAADLLVPEDEEAQGKILQPHDSSIVTLSDPSGKVEPAAKQFSSGRSLPTPPELTMPSLPAASWLRTLQESKTCLPSPPPRLLQPIHWSSCPPTANLPLPLASWSSCPSPLALASPGGSPREAVVGMPLASPGQVEALQAPEVVTKSRSDAPVEVVGRPITLSSL